MTTRRLVADIGGTNARFAIAVGGMVGAVHRVKVADHPSLYEAMSAYVETLPQGERPTEAAIDIAGPVHGDHIALTNAAWSFSMRELQQRMGFERLRVFNDFAAVAMSVPFLSDDELADIGPRLAKDKTGVIGVIGPGTGLGVGALIHDDGKWITVPGEGGHVTMAPTTDREDAIIMVLRMRWSHVSAERVVSGEGLVNIYTALCELDGITPDDLAPADITDRAVNKTDPLCVETFEHLCCILGTLASNLAVTLYATGGVYIGGGILRRFVSEFAASGFRDRFEAKGRFAGLMKTIPTRLILNESPALVGLANARM